MTIVSHGDWFDWTRWTHPHTWIWSSVHLHWEQSWPHTEVGIDTDSGPNCISYSHPSFGIGYPVGKTLHSWILVRWFRTKLITTIMKKESGFQRNTGCLMSESRSSGYHSMLWGHNFRVRQRLSEGQLCVEAWHKLFCVTLMSWIGWSLLDFAVRVTIRNVLFQRDRMEPGKNVLNSPL